MVNKQGYFVIKCTADGLTFDGPITADTLEKRLCKDYYGSRRSFASEVPPTDGFSLQLDERDLLIIKGEIVQPRQVQTVTEYKLP